jgi:hypothetical protein
MRCGLGRELTAAIIVAFCRDNLQFYHRRSQSHNYLHPGIQSQEKINPNIFTKLVERFMILQK